MASIFFLVDATEGHIYPTFGFAHALKNAGHSVTYLTILHYEGLIRKQGFEVRTLFHDLYPGHPDNQQKGYIDPRLARRNPTLIPRLIEGELDALFEHSRPDILIMTFFLLLEAVIVHYKYKIQPVILTPFLPFPGTPKEHVCARLFIDKKGAETVQIAQYFQSFGKRTFEDILHPVSTFPELVLCPSELEIEPLPGKRNCFYIQPSVYTGLSAESGTNGIHLPANKRIIYASLGSNAVAYEDKHRIRFYKTVVDTILKLEMPDLHLILSIGKGFDAARLGDRPANITVVNWAPQFTILQKTSLAIIHGGLGSIKECIYHSVPMIIVPMGFEQFRNADLISTHKLGVSRKIEEITGETLLSDIACILDDRQMKENVGKMQQIFREREEAQPGNQVIEDLLKRSR